MKIGNYNIRRYHIAPALSLVVTVLLAGCDQSPKNDLEQWIDVNAAQPFKRIQVSRDGKRDLMDLMAELHLGWNGTGYSVYPPAPPEQMPKALQILASDLINRQADFERKYGKNDMRLVPLAKAAPEIAQRIGAAVKSAGLEGDGASYILFSRGRCLDAAGKSAYEAKGTKIREEIDESLKTEFKREKKSLNSGEKKQLENWFMSWFVAEVRHDEDIATCHHALLTPAYRVSILYVEGSRGYWIPHGEVNLDKTWVEGRLKSGEGCGFDPDKHAVPEWVREACRERQRVSLEADEGLALSASFQPWVYTHAGLKLLLKNHTWHENFKREAIMTVRAVEEEK